MRYPEEKEISLCEIYLEVLAILLLTALVILAMWALPVWVLLGLYAGVVAGSFAITGVIEWVGRRHVRRSPWAHRHHVARNAR